MSNKDAILAQATKLAADIRAWSLSQAHLWQQLPNLALEANGRDGWMGDWTECSERGIWGLSAAGFLGADRALLADCATGRLIKGGSVNRFADASDQQVLWLAPHLRLIDVLPIIGRLSDMARQPRPWYISEQEWARREERREIARQRYGLGYGKPYICQRSPVATAC